MSGRARSATTSSSTRCLRDCSEATVRRIGIDVGGTNTDAVLLDGARVVHAVKAPTTEDVTGGIVAALSRLTRHPEIAGTHVDAIVIGTTHFINAVMQRRHLSKVAAPASAAGRSSSTAVRCGPMIEAPMTRSRASCSGCDGPLRKASISRSVT